MGGGGGGGYSRGDIGSFLNYSFVQQCVGLGDSVKTTWEIFWS